MFKMVNAAEALLNENGLIGYTNNINNERMK